MKILIGLLLLLSSVGYTESIEDIYPSVVKIETTGGQHGSGFVYRQDADGTTYAITAAHVVEVGYKASPDAPFQKIVKAGDTYVSKELVSSIQVVQGRDLAFIKFKSKKIYIPLLVGKKLPNLMDRCQLISFPMGKELWISKGDYLGKSQYDFSNPLLKDAIKSNVMSATGSSGGPLVCSGKVVGILFGGFRGTQYMSIFTPVLKKDLL